MARKASIENLELIPNLKITCAYCRNSGWYATEMAQELPGIRPGDTYEKALALFASHLETLATMTTSWTAFHFFGVKIEIDVKFDKIDPNRLGDQVYFNGKSVGNRCGAREEYMKLCAPYIRKLAMMEATK